MSTPYTALESTDESFRHDRLAGDDAVTLDELHRLGMCRFGRGRFRVQQGFDEAPPTLAGGRSDPGEATGTGPTPPVRGAALGGGLDLGPTDHRAQRRQRVVGDLACPHEIPERSEQFLILSAGRRLTDLPPEARASLGEQRANGLLQRPLGRFALLPAGREER